MAARRAVHGCRTRAEATHPRPLPVADAGCEELTLILDDWSALLAGQDGATVDPASVADNASEEPIANGFGGNLDVPAPGASPVFTTALGILG